MSGAMAAHPAGAAVHVPLLFAPAHLHCSHNGRQWERAWQHVCRAVLQMLKLGLRPRDIMTKAAIRNALTMVMALGGSTNAVLHFLAIARAAGVDLTLDDFQRVSDQTPLIADLKPSGRYVMEDLHHVSGWGWGRGWGGGVQVGTLQKDCGGQSRNVFLVHVDPHAERLSLNDSLQPATHASSGW